MTIVLPWTLAAILAFLAAFLYARWVNMRADARSFQQRLEELNRLLDRDREREAELHRRLEAMQDRFQATDWPSYAGVRAQERWLEAEAHMPRAEPLPETWDTVNPIGEPVRNVRRENVEGLV